MLVVHLTNESKLERARTAIRNFVADHLKTRDEKDAALVAFVSPTERQWRFSYVKMEYAAVETEAGRVGVETRLTPAHRYSFIVDVNCFTHCVEHCKAVTGFLPRAARHFSVTSAIGRIASNTSGRPAVVALLSK